MINHPTTIENICIGIIIGIYIGVVYIIGYNIIHGKTSTDGDDYPD